MMQRLFRSNSASKKNQKVFFSQRMWSVSLLASWSQVTSTSWRRMRRSQAQRVKNQTSTSRNEKRGVTFFQRMLTTQGLSKKLSLSTLSQPLSTQSPQVKRRFWENGARVPIQTRGWGEDSKPKQTYSKCGPDVKCNLPEEPKWIPQCMLFGSYNSHSLCRVPTLRQRCPLQCFQRTKSWDTGNDRSRYSTEAQRWHPRRNISLRLWKEIES